MVTSKNVQKDSDLVSIIVPSYKRKKNIVFRAINSLLTQTYKNIEVILVDDNATLELAGYRSELEGMVENLAEERLVYIQNKQNLGGAGARNEGIKRAKGNYVTFLDDDDLYLPQKVEKQLAFMKDKGLDMSFSKLTIYNENDELIDVRCHDDIENFDKEYLRRYHLTKQITGTPTFMMKKEVLDAVGGFEVVIMGQEFYLMDKILKTDYKIGYYPDSHIKAYRTSAEAISTGKNKIIGEKALYAYKKSLFNTLNFNERRYVRCRHYAVMAIAYKRNKKYLRMFFNLCVSVFCAPLLSVKEMIAFFRRRKEC